MFPTDTRVDFSDRTTRGKTVMELVALDRPGLLGKVGQAFVDCNIDIDTVKILTIGERAEDVFYISDDTGRPLNAAAKRRLRDSLVASLG